MRKILGILIAFGLTFTIMTPASAAAKQGIYQLDFIPLSTNLGEITLAEGEVKLMVSKLNNAYRAITNGKFGIELRSILPGVKTSDPMKSVTDMTKLLNPTLKVDTGYAGAILIGYMPRDTNVVFAGQAQGNQYVLLNFPINESFKTLMHEIGHNFGLAHAGTAVCSPTDAPSTCAAIEYGDYSDFMGNYVYGNPPGATVARTSAFNLDNLGVLDSSQITYVDTSTTLDLVPVYGTGPGIKLAYLPILGQRGYAIEYRPAIGDDLQLMATEVPVPGTNSYYPNQPSHGVQVRLLPSVAQSYKSAAPTITYSGFQDISKNSGFSGAMSNLLEKFDKGRQGMDPGESVKLFDGSIVTVLKAEANIGASISITRPLTTMTTQFAPNAVSARWDTSATDLTYEDTAKKIALIPPTSTSALPVIRVEYKLPETAIRLLSSELIVNGTSVLSANPSELIYNNAGAPLITPSAAFTYAPKSLGEYKVSIRVKDAAGVIVESPAIILKSKNPDLKDYTDLCLQKKGWPATCSAYPVFQFSFCDTFAQQSISLQTGKKYKLIREMKGVINPTACTDGKNIYFYDFVGNYPDPKLAKAVYKTSAKATKGRVPSEGFFTIVLKKGKR